MAESANPPRSTYAPQPVVGVTAEQLMEMIKALRAPSDEEIQRKEEEAQRRKEMARQAIMLAEQDLTNQMGLHQACIHRNEKFHTFVGQNTGDGNTVAICQICRKDYKWRTTPDQMRQGVNLIDYRGLTEATLLAWEKQFPAIGLPPDRIKLRTRAGKEAA